MSYNRVVVLKIMYFVVVWHKCLNDTPHVMVQRDTQLLVTDLPLGKTRVNYKFATWKDYTIGTCSCYILAGALP